MTKTAHNLIGGEWTGSPEVERRNPARPGEVAVHRAVVVRRRRGRRGVGGRRRPARLGRAAPAGAGRGPAWTPPTSCVRGTSEVARDLVAEEGKTLAEAKRRGAAGDRRAALLRRPGLARRGRRAAQRDAGDDGGHPPGAAGRRRPDHAVELPDRHPRLEDGARADQRQRRRAQAGGADPADRGEPGARARRGGSACGRAERRARHRRGGRRRAGARPRVAPSRSPARPPSGWGSPT